MTEKDKNMKIKLIILTFLSNRKIQNHITNLYAEVREARDDEAHGVRDDGDHEEVQG